VVAATFGDINIRSFAYFANVFANIRLVANSNTFIFDHF